MTSIVGLIYGTSVKIYDRKSEAFKNDSFEAGVSDGSDIMTSICGCLTTLIGQFLNILQSQGE